MVSGLYNTRHLLQNIVFVKESLKRYPGTSWFNINIKAVDSIPRRDRI
nr:MAG TPA: hypothetical protein [Caudoviricetes sp.]